ncbi:GNAT family N-acetyltransferase [Paenibacillus sp. NPDC058071]|uniref:GNAT family N-acetyltransferase n=1 Tax=Paenibacillus sp. NPDC058071 TaxID=3346326 RepID=UPI0036DACBC4
MDSNTTVKQVQTNEDRDAIYQIRKHVFVEEQGVAEDREYDEYEDSSQHVLVLHKGEPVATGRVRSVDGIAKLERICVLSSHRGLGLGKVVVEALEDTAKANGWKKAKLNGQTHAESFYEKLGYKTTSDIFMEEGIPHVTMTKLLD